MLRRTGGERGRIVGKIQLNVNSGFVQITQCVMPAAGLLEVLTKSSKRLEGVTVTSSQKVQISAIVLGLHA